MTRDLATDQCAPGVPPAAARRHLRLVPAPDPEPPYETVVPLPSRRGDRRPSDTGQQPLPLLWVLPGGVPAAPVVDDDDFALPVLTPGSELPPPGPWCARIVVALVEVLHGVRPPAQLVRWVAPRVHADVAARSRRQAPRRTPVRVRSVRLCAVGPGSVEAAVVAQWGGRAHAVALRLDGLDGRWQVTALAVG